MLVGIDTMLPEARKGGYAVGSFNVNNMETAHAILEAAVERKSPVILAFGEGGMYSLLPMGSLVAAMREMAQPLPVPVAIILDHGRTFEGEVRAIRSGATSVMFDGSVLPFAENVERTREVVKIAHAAGVAVEAEVGHVGQGADYAGIESERDQLFTKPEQAVEFVRLTGVDALAVAVGTAHGVYVGKSPELDYDRLASIREVVPVPLVLHGGSGTGDAKLAKAVENGIAKVNIYTDMGMAARDRVRAMLSEKGDKAKFIDVLLDAKAAFKEISGHYMDVFGSTGKA